MNTDNFALQQIIHLKLQQLFTRAPLKSNWVNPPPLLPPNNTIITRCRDSRTAKVQKQGRDDHIKKSSMQPFSIIFNMHIPKKRYIGGCMVDYFDVIIPTLFLQQVHA